MKSYAIVGTGNRALGMFGRPLAGELKDFARLVGVCDRNHSRAAYFSSECGNVPVFDSFDEMLKQTKPDCVIVTVIDRYHHEYIIRALEAGCDVISEKPMTIDAEKCRAVLDAEKRTGKKVTVIFNMRYMPYIARIKELLNQGIVGDIFSVNFQWLLDTSHGADYFRRWHRYLDNSGGLLVHKATHHFDAANWWIGDRPKQVFAYGSLRFYGQNGEQNAERCLTCQNRCRYYWDIAKERETRKLYLECEKDDGYYRDRCVFAKDINIYDTMGLDVRYQNGAILTYSLTAHSPYEGWKMAINGSNGRLEIEEFSSGPQSKGQFEHARFFNRYGEMIEYTFPKTDGEHGGGDERLRRMIFVGDVKDELGQQAGTMDGAMSLLIGAAANQSIRTGQPVNIDDLLKEPTNL